MATSNGQWAANVNQAESDALASKSIAQENNRVRLTLGGNLETAQGASTTVGLNSNDKHFNDVAPTTHGALYDPPSQSLTGQALQTVLPLLPSQQRADVGWAAEQSANNYGNTATPVVTSDAKSQYNVPTAPVAKNTGGQWQNAPENQVPNVASRFMR